MIYLKKLNGICSGILLYRWHDSLILKNVSYFAGNVDVRRIRTIKNCRQNTRFIYFVEFPYFLQIIMCRWFSTENEDKNTRFGNLIKKDLINCLQGHSSCPVIKALHAFCNSFQLRNLFWFKTTIIYVTENQKWCIDDHNKNKLRKL